MGLLQSSRAYADMQRPEAWGNCDRCNFRYNRSRLSWQYDWRGDALQNLRILVCDICNDKPYEFNRPIIIGPDPYPIKDPRPGFAATEQGPQPPVQTPLEIIDNEPGTIDIAAGLFNNGGALMLTSTRGYPTTTAGLLPGAVWNNGLEVAVVPGATPNPAFPAIYYGFISASALLAIGGGNLPTTGGTPGSNQLWNNGGAVAVS